MHRLAVACLLVLTLSSSHAAGDAAAGREVFNQYCYHCHGTDAVQGERVRDLRRLQRRYAGERQAVFRKTVTEGRTDKGMPVWGGVLSEAQLTDIWAFLETVQAP